MRPLRVYWVFGQILILLGQKCNAVGQVLIFLDGHILYNNLAIWSHCTRHFIKLGREIVHLTRPKNESNKIYSFHFHFSLTAKSEALVLSDEICISWIWIGIVVVAEIERKFIFYSSEIETTVVNVIKQFRRKSGFHQNCEIQKQFISSLSLQKVANQCYFKSKIIL